MAALIDSLCNNALPVARPVLNMLRLWCEHTLSHGRGLDLCSPHHHGKTRIRSADWVVHPTSTARTHSLDMREQSRLACSQLYKVEGVLSGCWGGMEYSESMLLLASSRSDKHRSPRATRLPGAANKRATALR